MAASSRVPALIPTVPGRVEVTLAQRLTLALAPLAVAVAVGCGEKPEPTGTLPADPPASESSPGTSARAFEIRGHFRGRLTQRGLKPFRVDVRIRSLRSPTRNPVRYSGLGCAGSWRYLGKDGDTFRFRERISSGRTRQAGTGSRKCKGLGAITLRPLGSNRLGYRFEGGGVTSRGTLSRVGAG